MDKCPRGVHPVLSVLLQELEVEDFGPMVGEVSSSWEVNAERLANTVGKLCKMESQNHMSPR